MSILFNFSLPNKQLNSDQPTLVVVSRIYQCLGDYNLMLATLLSHFFSEFIQHESD